MNVDPFVSTIIKQAVAAGIAVGLLVALAYGLVQYSKLQYAISLNTLPGQLW